MDLSGVKSWDRATLLGLSLDSTLFNERSPRGIFSVKPVWVDIVTKSWKKKVVVREFLEKN